MLAVIGILAKSAQPILHPYSLTLNGTVYYHDNSPIQSGEFLYLSQYSNSKPSNIIENNSTNDIDQDGNYDDWAISSAGQLSYTTRVYFTQSIVIEGIVYYYNGALTQGTVLYMNPYSGSSYAANLGPVGGTDIDSDGKTDLVSTNNYGALSWSSEIIYPNTIVLGLGGTYYYTGTLQSGVTVLYTTPYSDALVPTSKAGINVDIDGDGNFDVWNIDGSGIITYSTQIIYENNVSGLFYFTGQLSNGDTIVYDGPYSSANIIANYSSSTGFDFDGDGNLDSWSTNSQGVITWAPIIANPNTIVLNSNTYYYSGTLTSDSTVIVTTPYTGGSPLSNSSGQGSIINGDNNVYNWFTDYNGIITYSMQILYPNSVLGYYYTGNLSNGYTVLYNGQGSAAGLAAENAGVADVDGDGNDDDWIINPSGILSWGVHQAHPNQINLTATILYGNPVNYQSVPVYIDNLPLTQGIELYNNSTSAAGVYLNSAGEDDMDGDGNLDIWYTDSGGSLNWSMAIVYESILENYYYTGNLVNGATILYTGQGSGASVASNAAGTNWYTDGTGVYYEN